MLYYWLAICVCFLFNASPGLHVTTKVSLSQEHASGQSGCQNCRVGSVARIPRDQRSSRILATDPTRLFWQPDWPQTCSWFYLMLYFNYSILGGYTLLYNAEIWCYSNVGDLKTELNWHTYDVIWHMWLKCDVICCTNPVKKT